MSKKRICPSEKIADKPNKKRLTDVTEFRYIMGNEIFKVYLSKTFPKSVVM